MVCAGFVVGGGDDDVVLRGGGVMGMVGTMSTGAAAAAATAVSGAVLVWRPPNLSLRKCGILGRKPPLLVANYNCSPG